NAVWGFFFAAWKTSLRRGRCAHRTDKDADIPVRAAPPTLDPLTLREQSSLLQVISARLRCKLYRHQ
ncbi:hypothetical protein N5C38_25790, partial [Pseudomonas chengduensis]